MLRAGASRTSLLTALPRARRQGRLMAIGAAAVTALLGATALTPNASASPGSAAPAASPVATLRARGASLVYIKNGDIYLAHADGSRAVVVKKGSYRWPSMDDQGVIAAERPDGRTAEDGSPGWSIYRFRQSGKKLSRVSTPTDYSSFSCPRYPSSHVTLSPDGTKVAYDYLDLCFGSQVATWTPSTKMTLHTQADYTAPAWLSSATMLISHAGVTASSSQAEIGTWGTNDSTSGWSTSIADDWATAYHATATRDGKIVALLEDDAANYFDGVPRHVTLLLGTAEGVGQPITQRCTVNLPPAKYDASSWSGTAFASLSFNPAGTALAWDAENGLWRAKTGNLSDCSTLGAGLWIKGAADGFFSPAPDTR